MGFEFEQDARAMHSALTERLAKFGLALHPEKTRVLQFGRQAREDRARQGLPKPETFDFLGFTHIASVDLHGRFQLRRRTSRKKMHGKFSRMKEEFRRRRHHRVAEQHAWLTQVLRGHYRYYGVPTNHAALAQFRRQIHWMWHRSLQRRSQRSRWTQTKARKFDERFPLPPPRIHHPWPDRRFRAR